MTTLRDRPGLDDTVRRACARLDDAGVMPPDVLFLLATGASALAEHLEDGHEVELGEFEELPFPWRGALLFSGRLGGLRAWALDDVGGDPDAPSGEPAWSAGLPVWLAAASGAEVLVHASAGTALAHTPPRAVGSYALVRDHLNLSGASPLTGLGESRLGPLFPDQSRVHHVGLRRAATGIADRLRLSTFEAVAACTAGPALETPAERAMLARLGADVVVQSLASPLIASAHAGLATLAIVAVSDVASDDRAAPGGARPTDVAELVQRACDAEPELERLLLELVTDLQRATDVLRAENEA